MRPPKNIQREWYKKLRESGFVDIEHPVFQHPNNKYSTWYFEGQWDIATFKDRQRYFRLAGQHLYTFRFRSIRDKSIWRLHAEGFSNREIQEKLDVDHNTVHSIIVRIRKHIKVD